MAGFAISCADTLASITIKNENKDFALEYTAVTTLNLAQSMDVHPIYYHTHHHNTIHPLKLNLMQQDNSPVLTTSGFCKEMQKWKRFLPQMIWTK